MFRYILALLTIAALVALALFYTGFWTAEVEDGALPRVGVSAKGGEMPSMNFETKKFEVGTKEADIKVPTITTEKKRLEFLSLGLGRKSRRNGRNRATASIENVNR